MHNYISKKDDMNYYNYMNYFRCDYNNKKKILT